MRKTAINSNPETPEQEAGTLSTLSVTCSVYSYDNNKAQEQEVPVFTVSLSLQRNTEVIKLTSVYGRPSCSPNIREGQSIIA